MFSTRWNKGEKITAEVLSDAWKTVCSSSPHNFKNATFFLQPRTSPHFSGNGLVNKSERKTRNRTECNKNDVSICCWGASCHLSKTDGRICRTLLSKLHWEKLNKPEIRAEGEMGVDVLVQCCLTKMQGKVIYSEMTVWRGKKNKHTGGSLDSLAAQPQYFIINNNKEPSWISDSQ